MMAIHRYYNEREIITDNNINKKNEIAAQLAEFRTSGG